MKSEDKEYGNDVKATENDQEKTERNDFIVTRDCQELKKKADKMEAHGVDTGVDKGVAMVFDGRR